jgi:hypothetical protein
VLLCPCERATETTWSSSSSLARRFLLMSYRSRFPCTLFLLLHFIYLLVLLSISFLFHRCRVFRVLCNKHPSITCGMFYRIIKDMMAIRKRIVQKVKEP